jgi:hypothetical protein
MTRATRGDQSRHDDALISAKVALLGIDRSLGAVAAMAVGDEIRGSTRCRRSCGDCGVKSKDDFRPHADSFDRIGRLQVAVSTNCEIVEPEPTGVRVDDGLHTVQERRDSLDLVDEHGSSRRGRRSELCLAPLSLGDILAKMWRGWRG